VCVVEARQGRVDWYTATATGIGILEYRSTTNAPIVREEGSSVSFSLRFCGRPSSGYFRRLAHVRADFKTTREDRITLRWKWRNKKKCLSALARRVTWKKWFFPHNIREKYLINTRSCVSNFLGTWEIHLSNPAIIESLIKTMTRTFFSFWFAIDSGWIWLSWRIRGSIRDYLTVLRNRWMKRRLVTY